jgi:hypothetical protein
MHLKPGNIRVTYLRVMHDIVRNVMIMIAVVNHVVILHLKNKMPFMIMHVMVMNIMVWNVRAMHVLTEMLGQGIIWQGIWGQLF